MSPTEKRNTEGGQTTLEFALTLILLMAFVLFYFQLTMIFALGNYAHYATFMAARAYLAAGPNGPDQEQRARDTIAMMLKRGTAVTGADRFPSILKGVGGDDNMAGLSLHPPAQFVPGDKASSWMQGVRYTFQGRLFLLPLGGAGGRNQSANSVTLTSESWLGREPNFDECQSQVGSPAVMGLIDNGC